MRNLFVNLPLGYIKRLPEYLEYFLENGIQPELGMDGPALDSLELPWHRQLSATLRRAGLECGVHLPFMDLQPGSRDGLILYATRKRLEKAFEIAQLYSPRHMVAHAAYVDVLHGEYYEQWVEASIETWAERLAAWPGHPPLYLENVFETEPGPLLAVASGVKGAGLCLDLGHWHSFARGFERRDLAVWVRAMAPHLGHLHLHDNDGLTDRHWGLGQGAIPWQELFSALRQRGLSPSMTLEPHTEEDLLASKAFVQAHPEWFPA